MPTRIRSQNKTSAHFRPNYLNQSPCRCVRHVVLFMETDLVICVILRYCSLCLKAINKNIDRWQLNAVLRYSFVSQSCACCTEQRIRFTYKTLLSTRDGGDGGGGGWGQLQHGHQAKLYSYLLSNRFALISLICHLKKKASRAATHTHTRLSSSDPLNFIPKCKCTHII